jgi:Pyridoxamine 5'-phosphate oxidase
VASLTDRRGSTTAVTAGQGSRLVAWSSVGAVRRDPLSSDLRSLIDAPSPATLTLYREDGEAITSPMWFRLDGDDFEAVVAATDHKLDHLRRDPRCILLIFEAVRPFRGLQVRASASISPDEEARVRLAIASRYLGPDAGRVYADLERRAPGFVIRLPLREARAWDLADKLP